MRIRRDIIYLILIILLLGLCGQFYYSYKYQPAHERDVRVYYNQDHKLNREIIDLTREADKFVYFAVYTFTREDIKDALLAAKYRGLTVIGITDKNQYSQLASQKKLIKELENAGIPVYEQNHSAIMHLKVIVTDKGYASGSYNWTTSATEVNDEVLEVGHEPELRAKYQAILEELFNKYKAYKPDSAGTKPEEAPEGKEQ